MILKKKTFRQHHLYLESKSEFWVFWGVVILCLTLEVHAQMPSQRFANEPSPQTAVLGSTVVLPCRVINKVGELQWTRDGFGLGNERELFAFKRYGMIGADEEGDFSLRISPVTLEDDAEFQCQVTGWKTVPGVRSQTAKLTVYVPPEPPEMLQGSVIKTTAGAGVQIECLSKGGKPAAEIQWLDGSGRVIEEGVKFHKQLLQDGHRYDSRSTLTFIAGREHHNTVLTCAATNPALNQPLRTQVRLEVTYPPEVQILQDKEGGYKESETAVLTCSASANPNKLSFRWYRGGKLVSEGNQTKLYIKDVRRDVSLEDVTCEVANEVGTSKKITRLIVHYGPSFRVDPKDVYAEEGEEVTLKCQVDGSPKPKIVWIPQKNSSYIYGTGGTLTLRASKETVGTYLCLVKVEDFPEISTTVGLFLKGPPVIKAERLQWGIVGDTSQVECYVHSATPNSVQVTWMQAGKKIDIVNGRYEIEKEITGDGVVVRLVIKRAKMEDFDTYNCSVQNAFGSDIVDVILKRKKSVPLFLLVTGIIGGVIFILVVAVGVIYFGKRKATKQKGKELYVKNGDLPKKTVSLQINSQNSTGSESDLKLELENRTGSSLSTKDPELDHSWDKGRENEDGHGYLQGTSSYLYPENYTDISMKMNGHTNSVANLTYGEFTDHHHSIMNEISAKQHSTTPLGYTPMSSPYPRNHTTTLPSNKLNLYQAYHQGMESQQPDVVEGLRGLSSTYSNNLANHNNYKNNTSTQQPLSLQINCSPGSGPGAGGGIISSQSLSPGSNTIPRLGIPVDPSQYIVPPRTQLLQGALATHV